MKAEFHFAGEPVAFAVVDNPAVRALLDGRTRIANGWCQDELSVYRPDRLGGPMYCAIGAIGSNYDAETALIRALPAAEYSLTEYNDAPGRTQDDILALYDRAIASARAS